jgi:F0F1-type ATP synthase assembly protein I
VSHPPEYPGRQRLKRLSTRAGTDAYQGAFEAVGAVLVACGFGYWFDRSWETGPWGLVVGVVIGFAAMVLRLIRLGEELHPGEEAETEMGPGYDDDDLGVGVFLGMSEVLRDEAGPIDSETPNTETTEESR